MSFIRCYPYPALLEKEQVYGAINKKSVACQCTNSKHL